MKRLELFHFLMNGDIKKVKRFLAENGVPLKSEQIIALRKLIQ